MANTRGFELIIQASRNLIVKALKGAWKSAECPDQPGDDGRIPEFMDIPPVGSIGGYPIIDGQIQIPQEELSAEFAPDVNGVELILGLKTQIEIGNPPVPSAQILDFHAVLHAKAPINTIPNSQDVGILLNELIRTNVWAVLDQGHPLDGSIEELLQDYVHKAYEDEEIPHIVPATGVETISFLVGTCNTQTRIYDDQSNVARQILTSFPDANTIRISIPIYLRMFAFIPNPLVIAGISINMKAPMGIETRIIIDAPFEKYPDKYMAKFGNVTAANVTIDPIQGVGSDIGLFSAEAQNYLDNKATLAGLIVPQDLDALISDQLKNKGVDFANDLGNREVSIPSISEIETTIADIFYSELQSRGQLMLWSPTATNNQFQVDSVNVKVFSNSLNIALNDTGASDINALTYFIPDGMDFSIAMSREALEEKIERSRVEDGFDNPSLPKRFNEEGKDVDLNSLNVSIVNNAIRLTGTITVIDAVLGSIDVDASFRTDVGLHWEPNGSLNSAGGQLPQHHIIGDPDVDVEEGIAFWIIAIILTIISFGVGGIFIGIIAIVVLLVVKSIIENIGSDSFVNGATGAIDGISGWPSVLPGIGTARAVFFDPIEISTEGLLMSGQIEVISSCQSTQVVPATTAGKYTANAMQSVELKALRIYNQADFIWNAGDGSADQLLKTVYKQYENSGIYIAKHGVSVTEYGGASSRHFAVVRIKNVPPKVNAGSDITVNEGEVVALEAHFEDVEYLDTHWSLWNFGDNQPMIRGHVEETNQRPMAKGVTKVQHAWCDNGVYYVTVQVIDNNGGVGIDSIKVTVLNVPPVVITPEKTFAYPCSPITMVGHFTDPGWCDTHVATWQFGDCAVLNQAQVIEKNESPATKGTATASHTYKKCGTYYAECVVMDDDGGVGKSQTIIEVIELKNAHFNDGFSFHNLGKVANFWTPFYVPNTKQDSFERQEKAERLFCEKCIVYDGLSSQKIMANNGSLVGIYQCLGANPNWVYQISALYMLEHKNAKAKLGMDPTGGNDPLSDSIVWSEGQKEGIWTHISQRICAQSDCITIFLGLEASEDASLTACCFDIAEVIAMQNISCEQKSDVVQTPKSCVDFKGLSPQMELPIEWYYKGILFISMSQLPNKVVQHFPPDYAPCLEISRGLILKFEEEVDSPTLEFCYSAKGLHVGILATDRQGNVIMEKDVELQSPSMQIHTNGENISSLQIHTRGEGGLLKICYHKKKDSVMSSNFSPINYTKK